MLKMGSWPLFIRRRFPNLLFTYLAYFRAVDQALLETLVLVHVENASLSNATKRAQDLAELRAVVRSIGNEEIGLFGSVCQKRLNCVPVEPCPQSSTNACCLADGTSIEN